MNNETRIMAVFCDFENVALGVRDAKYDSLDIRKILERLLLKGNIVVRKAYCDWARYEKFKPSMHEASFELIEIPHVRQSGKNSADIRMVVDALDLCYTKEHVDTFVVVSGDSDFSPLVSKLRENNKTVIGVGVKNSTSELLISICDEFIYYDDLVQKRAPSRRRRGTRATKKSTTTAKSSTKKTPAKKDKTEEVCKLVMGTYDALLQERGEDDHIWGSMIKQTLKRQNPGFSESYYGFRSFNELLEEAEDQGYLKLQRDAKSGGYTVTNA